MEKEWGRSSGASAAGLRLRRRIQRPVILVPDGGEILAITRAALEAEGYEIRRGFEPPSRRYDVGDLRVVCEGQVTDPESRARAINAAARGAGLLIFGSMPFRERALLCDDLRSFGEVEIRDGNWSVISRLDREAQQMLALLGQGRSLASISAELGYSVRTVNRRLAKVKRDIGVGTTTELLVRFRESRSPPTGQGASQCPPPLEGRETESESLLRALGRGCVLVKGEAGAGKTCLVESVLSGAGVEYLYGDCLSSLSRMPYLPLSRAVGSRLSGEPQAISADLTALLNGRVLVVDNAQWCDRQSMKMLDELAGNIGLVLIVRTGDPGSGSVFDLARRVGAEEIEVDYFGSGEARRILARHRPDLSESEASKALEQAAGMPMLLAGSSGSGTRKRLDLQLAARLAHLSDSALMSAERAAALGRPASPELLGEGARELVEAMLMQGPEEQLSFRFCQMERLVLDQIGSGQLSLVHAELARALDDPYEAAFHFEKAGEGEAAVASSIQALAGELVFGERATCLARVATGPIEPEAREVWLEAADALAAIGEYQRALDLLELRETASPGEEADSSAIRDRALVGLGISGQMEVPPPAGSNSPGPYIDSKLKLCASHQRAGQWDRSEEIAAGLAESCKAQKLPRRAAEVKLVGAAKKFFRDGEFHAVRELADDIRAESRDRTVVDDSAAFLSAMSSAADGSLALARRQVAGFKDESSARRTLMLAAMAETEWLARHPDRAGAFASRSIECGCRPETIYEFTGEWLAHPILAWSRYEHGLQPQDIDGSDTACGERSTMEVSALAALASGNAQRAIRLFGECSDAWKGRDIRSWIRVSWGRAEAQISAGLKKEAEGALLELEAEAYSRRMTPILARIRESLTRIGIVRRAKRGNSHLGISSRQIEIMSLVGAGLTSSEIAARLAISRSTVDRHVSFSVSRLAAGNRRQAAAIVLDALGGEPAGGWHEMGISPDRIGSTVPGPGDSDEPRKPWRDRS